MVSLTVRVNEALSFSGMFNYQAHDVFCTKDFMCFIFNYQVGDNQCLLQSLKDSPYYKLFEDKAGIWEQRLADLDEICHNLNQIQRKWVYLEPIFGRWALPKEQARFKRVDDDFR